MTGEYVPGSSADVPTDYMEIMDQVPLLPATETVPRKKRREFPEQVAERKILDALRQQLERGHLSDAQQQLLWRISANIATQLWEEMPPIATSLPPGSFDRHRHLVHYDTDQLPEYQKGVAEAGVRRSLDEDGMPIVMVSGQPLTLRELLWAHRTITPHRETYGLDDNGLSVGELVERAHGEVEQEQRLLSPDNEMAQLASPLSFEPPHWPVSDVSDPIDAPHTLRDELDPLLHPITEGLLRLGIGAVAVFRALGPDDEPRGRNVASTRRNS